jgi:predicted membrane channel-forming protein YqfA (hemolysin III family)
VTIYNRYFLTLAVLFTLSTTILAAYGQGKLDAYFTVFVIEYLVVTLLFAYLDPRARRLLDAMGYVLFGGFMVIVALKVIEILQRS